MAVISCQASLTVAGLAGGVTPVTGLGPAVMVVAWRAAPQALSRMPQVDVPIPTAPTISVTRTPTLATRGVTALASHVAEVAIVTKKEKGCFVNFFMFFNEKGERSRCDVCVSVGSSNLSKQVSTQLLPCLKNPSLQTSHCTLWRPVHDLQVKWQRSHTRSSLSSA